MKMPFHQPSVNCLGDDITSLFIDCIEIITYRETSREFNLFRIICRRRLILLRSARIRHTIILTDLIALPINAEHTTDASCRRMSPVARSKTLDGMFPSSAACRVHEPIMSRNLADVPRPSDSREDDLLAGQMRVSRAAVQSER
jgi:hypothetical protein